MLGDSITARGRWNELFVGCDIVHRGIEGETTAGAAARLDEVQRIGAKVVVVMLGTNDISHGDPTSDIAARYGSIIVRLGKTAKVFVISTTLRDVSQREINTQIIALNHALQKLCVTGDCTFIDLNATIAPEGFGASEYLVDGLHLSPAAYARWRDLIAKPIGCNI